MWLYLVGVVLAVLAIAGTVLGGGIFTIVLIPLAAIALISAVAASVLGRAAQPGGDGTGEEPALPHDRPREPGHVPTTPERLADARRVQQ
jgi:hypothetical protein